MKLSLMKRALAVLLGDQVMSENEQADLAKTVARELEHTVISPEQVNANMRAQWLQNVNMQLNMQVRQLKTALLLASSAGEILPANAEFLFTELLGCAGMVEQKKENK